MVIVDSSVVMAVLLSEPDSERWQAALLSSRCRMAAPSLVECSAVAGPRRQDLLDDLTVSTPLEIVPFTAEHARVARAAYLRFGKGSGSRARLNLGDCFSYALAKTTGEPLLVKGDDFTHTDITSATARD